MGMQMDQAGQKMQSKLAQLAEKLEQQGQQLEQDRAATESLRAEVERQAQGPSAESFAALQSAHEARLGPCPSCSGIIGIRHSLAEAYQYSSLNMICGRVNI